MPGSKEGSPISALAISCVPIPSFLNLFSDETFHNDCSANNVFLLDCKLENLMSSILMTMFCFQSIKAALFHNMSVKILVSGISFYVAVFCLDMLTFVLCLGFHFCFMCPFFLCNLKKIEFGRKICYNH